MSRSLLSGALLLVLPLVSITAHAVSAAPQATALSVPPHMALEENAARLPGLEHRVFTPEYWWERVTPLLLPERGFQVETIGHSTEGRPLQHVQWGNGDTHVLLWSQMHGDESTATMSLADLFHLLGEHPEHPFVAGLRDHLTLHVVPILNPDGAARFQRRNAQGIDINRDASALASPEARALKQLRDRLQPAYGFNLHDQRPGYRVGETDVATAIALLAPPMDENASINPVRARAIGVAARIREALEPHIPGKIARWDETFNPRAFGDLMQQWGTSTILLEAGGIEGDAQKQQLRDLTLLAIATGLQSIMDGSHATADAHLYQTLPENGEVWPDLLLRGATVHGPQGSPVQTDVLINFRHGLSFEDGRITDIGDLRDRPVRRTIDAHGLHLHPLPDTDSIAIDRPARLQLSRDTAGKDVVWRLDHDLTDSDPVPLNR